jgi:hypothetical protein
MTLRDTSLIVIAQVFTAASLVSDRPHHTLGEPWFSGAHLRVNSLNTDARAELEILRA